MITVVTCTAREEPHFDWLAEGIAAASSLAPVEWIVVDRLLWYEGAQARQDQLKWLVDGAYSLTHIPPKPTRWQGPSRDTQADLYALCNARNTALALAEGKRLVCIDDWTMLPANWVKWHFEADGYCLAGTFNQFDVDLSPIHGVEWRRKRWPVRTLIRGGYQLGANTSYEVNDLKAVNGWDEAFDGRWGYEDTDLGIRLERFGVKTYFEPKCSMKLVNHGTRFQGLTDTVVIEDEELPANAKLLQERIKAGGWLPLRGLK